MAKISWPQFSKTIPFRLNMGLITVYLISSGFVYYFFLLSLKNYLHTRLDEYLETEILAITSELDFSELPVRDPFTSPALQDSFKRFGFTHGVWKAFLFLRDENGAILASSDSRYVVEVKEISLPINKIKEHPFHWNSIELAETPFRAIYYQTPERYIIQIGFSLEETRALQLKIQSHFGVALLAILILGGFAGWIYSRHALKGLDYVRQSAMSIHLKSDLSQRVHTPTGSIETDELAITFNQMLARIQDLVNNLTYVMDNIAHDIRTPVTRMRGHAELRLRNQGLSELEMEMAGQVIEECDQILNLVNTLLEITAADSGLFQPRSDRVDLAELVRDGCDLFEPVWEEKQLSVTIQCPDRLMWQGDSRAFQRILSNLLDNAIKYSPRKGCVTVTLIPKQQKKCAGISLMIKDNGPGIAPDEQPLVFNRFYRCKGARMQPGNGLGLSFCKSVLEAMGGSITLISQPEKGAAFQICLPNSLL